MATAGFQPDVVGAVALASGVASIETLDDGVLSKAEASLQALTVGPVTIGEVRSHAEMKLDSFGMATPSTSLEISGMRVGTVPVALTGDGLVVGGPARPVPLNQSLEQLLKPSGITLEVLAAQSFPDRVLAPALKMTLPFAASPSGQGQTVMTVTIGSAVAALKGSAAASDTLGETLPTPGGDQTAATPIDPSPDGFGTGLLPPVSNLTEVPSLPLGEPGFSPETGSGPPATDNTPALSALPVLPAVPAAQTFIQKFAFAPVYLIFVVGALLALTFGIKVRRLGGRTA